MRPHGEERLALRDAAQELQEVYAEAGRPLEGPTARHIAEWSTVGYAKARETLANMVRAGELEIVARVPGSRGRRAAVYHLAPQIPATAQPTPIDEVRAMATTG